MIRVDKLTLKRLHAGKPVQFTHRSKRHYRRGHSYPVEVEGRKAQVRVLLTRATRKPGTKYVWVLACVLDRQSPVNCLAAKVGGGEMSEDGNRDYTSIPSMGASGEGEAPHRSEIADYRASKEAKDRYSRERMESVGGLLAACEDMRSAVAGLDPKDKRTAGRELWQLRGRLDALERRIKREIAA